MNATGPDNQHRIHDRRRGHGPILDSHRAVRVRELAEHPEPSGESRMPEPGHEWQVVLADLRRRANASPLNDSGQQSSPQ